jgi:Mn2+/Fe2+ NRAMP family transporter
MLLLATMMGLALQVMAARLGVVTGKNLARVCKEHYGRKTSLALWVLIEIAIVGCDLQEIVGSAVAFQILFGFPLWLGCLITFIDTFTFLGIHYFGVRKLESFFVMLVTIMTICFFWNFGKNPPPSRDIAEGFVPQIRPYAVLSAVGLIGAVIMPHNIYLHCKRCFCFCFCVYVCVCVCMIHVVLSSLWCLSYLTLTHSSIHPHTYTHTHKLPPTHTHTYTASLVLTRKIDRASPRQVKEANKYFTIDSFIALLVSFLINLAVVSVFAYHFFDPICASAPDGPLACLSRDTEGVCVCEEIGLGQAHDALASALGKSAKYIWGVGLLAAGQSSTMTGAWVWVCVCVCVCVCMKKIGLRKIRSNLLVCTLSSIPTSFSSPPQKLRNTHKHTHTH